jgi:excisionase family DNA binding protein
VTTISAPQLVTIPEAAEYLRVHPDTLGEYCRSGKVPATKLGRKWLIRVVDLAALTEQAGSAAGVQSERTGTLPRGLAS